MRNVISSQMQLGQTDIKNIIIDVSSRDDIPVILLGLQHIYINKSLRTAVFKILEEVIPHKTDTQTGCFIPVASDKGRPGMEQWSILVLGTRGVKGPVKVMYHLMFGILALTSNQMMCFLE